MPRSNANAGGGVSTGFIGFGAFANLRVQGGDGAGASDSPGSSRRAGASPFYSGSDSEISASMKLVGKRDTTSKLRGLADMLAIIRPSDGGAAREKWVLIEFSGAWIVSFNALVLHNDRRVRMAALNVTEALAAAGLRRVLSAHLPSLLAAALLLATESVRDIAAAADSMIETMLESPADAALERGSAARAAAAERARTRAVATAASDVLEKLFHYLFAPPAELNEAIIGTEEEAAERADRVRPAAVDALAALVLRAAPAATEQSGGSSEDAAVSRELLCALKGVFAPVRFWRLCMRDGAAPHIRARIFCLLRVLATSAPSLIADSFAPGSPVVVRLPLPALINTGWHAAMCESDTVALHAALGAAQALARSFPAVWGFDAELDGPSRETVLKGAVAKIALLDRVSVKEEAAPFRAVPDDDSPTVTFPAALDAVKALWPPLIARIRAAPRGNEHIVFDEVLPILATLPPRIALTPAALRILAELQELLEREGDAESSMFGSSRLSLLRAVAEMSAFFIVTAARASSIFGTEALSNASRAGHSALARIAAFATGDAFGVVVRDGASATWESALRIVYTAAMRSEGGAGGAAVSQLRSAGWDLVTTAATLLQSALQSGGLKTFTRAAPLLAALARISKLDGAAAIADVIAPLASDVLAAAALSAAEPTSVTASVRFLVTIAQDGDAVRGAMAREVGESGTLTAAMRAAIENVKSGALATLLGLYLSLNRPSDENLLLYCLRWTLGDTAAMSFLSARDMCVEVAASWPAKAYSSAAREHLLALDAVADVVASVISTVGVEGPNKTTAEALLPGAFLLTAFARDATRLETALSIIRGIAASTSLWGGAISLTSAVNEAVSSELAALTSCVHNTASEEDRQFLLGHARCVLALLESAPKSVAFCESLDSPLMTTATELSEFVAFSLEDYLRDDARILSQTVAALFDRLPPMLKLAFRLKCAESVRDAVFHAKTEIIAALRASSATQPSTTECERALARATRGLVSVCTLPGSTQEATRTTWAATGCFVGFSSPDPLEQDAASIFYVRLVDSLKRAGGLDEKDVLAAATSEAEKDAAFACASLCVVSFWQRALTVTENDAVESCRIGAWTAPGEAADDVADRPHSQVVLSLRLLGENIDCAACAKVSIAVLCAFVRDKWKGVGATGLVLDIFRRHLFSLLPRFGSPDSPAARAAHDVLSASLGAVRKDGDVNGSASGTLDEEGLERLTLSFSDHPLVFALIASVLSRVSTAAPIIDAWLSSDALADEIEGSARAVGGLARLASNEHGLIPWTVDESSGPRASAAAQLVSGLGDPLGSTTEAALERAQLLLLAVSTVAGSQRARGLSPSTQQRVLRACESLAQAAVVFVLAGKSHACIRLLGAVANAALIFSDVSTLPLFRRALWHASLVGIIANDAQSIAAAAHVIVQANLLDARMVGRRGEALPANDDETAVTDSLLPLPPSPGIVAAICLVVMKRTLSGDITSTSPSSRFTALVSLSRAALSSWSHRHFLPRTVVPQPLLAKAYVRALTRVCSALIFGATESSSLLLRYALCGGTASKTLYILCLRILSEGGVALGLSPLPTGWHSDAAALGERALEGSQITAFDDEPLRAAIKELADGRLSADAATRLIDFDVPEASAALAAPLDTEPSATRAVDESGAEEAAPSNGGVLEPVLSLLSSGSSWISSWARTLMSIGSDSAQTPASGLSDGVVEGESPPTPSAASATAAALPPDMYAFVENENSYARVIEAIVVGGSGRGGVSARATSVSPQYNEGDSITCPRCTLVCSPYLPSCEACEYAFAAAADGTFYVPSAALASSSTAEVVEPALRTSLREEAQLGRALLPAALVDVLEAGARQRDGTWNFIETVSALCDDDEDVAEESVDASIDARAARVCAGAAASMALLRSWLLAISAVAGSTNGAAAAAVDAYLTAPAPRGAGFEALLTVAVHLVLHDFDADEPATPSSTMSGHRLRTAAAERIVCVEQRAWLSGGRAHAAAEAAGDAMRALTLALFLRTADTLPQRVAEWWRNMKTQSGTLLMNEVKAFVEQHVTPILFRAQTGAVLLSLEPAAAVVAELAPGAAPSDAAGDAPPAALAAALLPSALCVSSNSDARSAVAHWLPYKSAPPPHKLDTKRVRLRVDERLLTAAASFHDEDAEVECAVQISFGLSFPLKRATVGLERLEGLSHAAWRRVQVAMALAMGGVDVTTATAGVAVAGDSPAPASGSDGGASAGGGAAASYTPEDTPGDAAHGGVTSSFSLIELSLLEGAGGAALPAHCATHLLTAVGIFAEAVQRELEGVEPCPICFAVIAAVSKAVPRAACRNCKKLFHNECISRWFCKGGVAGKERSCPLCRSDFGTGQFGSTEVERRRDRAARRQGGGAQGPQRFGRDGRPLRGLMLAAAQRAEMRERLEQLEADDSEDDGDGNEDFLFLGHRWDQ